MTLDGKVALVTGGSGDIGSAIARTLAAEGAKVVVTYVGAEEAASATVQAIHDQGGKAAHLQLDQRDPAAIEACIKQVEASHGRLDILVNNAAWNIGIPFPELDKLTVDVWDRVLETNLRAPFLLARAAADLLKADGGGHIVNISSAGGISPGSSSIAYSSSKAGLNHLTRCMAVGLAPEVLVNCIAPGFLEGTRASANLDETYQEQARQGSLLKRAADKDDVADQVVSFCRTDSITGQTLVIDSGRFFH